MKTCRGCLHWCVCSIREDDLRCGYFMERKKTTPKPQTNADRIRAMSDEELAAFWGADGFCDICEEGCDHFTYIGDCEMQFLRWLKQPVKGGEGE